MSSPKISQKIIPFLWFDNQAEAAMNFYVSIFPNSEITLLKKWPDKAHVPSDSQNPALYSKALSL